MPKIVDHNAYRLKIVDGAVNVFRRLGYAGVGMREMAKELGMSKSALYHYYPSKESLFLACSAQVAKIVPDNCLPPIKAILKFSQDWETFFPGEVRIILDYIGNRNPEEVRKDEAITITTKGMVESFAPIVGTERVTQVLSVVFGFLLLRYFNGGINDWDELEVMLEKLIY